jgi:hypothetical protein
MDQDKEVHSQNGYKPAPPSQGLGQPEVVPTSQLAEVLREWKEQYDRERSTSESMKKKQQRRKLFGYDVYVELNPMPVIGAWQYLVEKTGINNRAIWRIISNESQYTSLTIADELVRAMDLPHYWHNGRLTIVPNPRWTQEKYIAYIEERGSCI